MRAASVHAHTFSLEEVGLYTTQLIKRLIRSLSVIPAAGPPAPDWGGYMQNMFVRAVIIIINSGWVAECKESCIWLGWGFWGGSPRVDSCSGCIMRDYCVRQETCVCDHSVAWLVTRWRQTCTTYKVQGQHTAQCRAVVLQHLVLWGQERLKKSVQIKKAEKF